MAKMMMMMMMTDPFTSNLLNHTQQQYGYDKTHEMGKPTEVSMAKPIVPAVVELYGKTHEMGKPKEVSMVKPIAPSVAELCGKTHDMGNPIGLLWQKPWDKNFNFKCWGAVSSR